MALFILTAELTRDMTPEGRERLNRYCEFIDAPFGGLFVIAIYIVLGTIGGATLAAIIGLF